jgi:hypothetical protein
MPPVFNLLFFQLHRVLSTWPHALRSLSLYSRLVIHYLLYFGPRKIGELILFMTQHPTN